MRKFFCGLFAAPLALLTALALAAPALLAAAPPLSPADTLVGYEHQFQAASSDVARVVVLYRIQELNGLLPPSVLLASLGRLAASAKVSALVNAEIQAQNAAEELRLGQAMEAAGIWHKLGVIETWKAVGPFNNSSPASIDTEEGPEKGIQLDAHYQGKQRMVGWRSLPFNATEGELELNSYFTPNESASVYLVSWVQSPTVQDVAIRLRDNGATRLFVNGQPVFDEQAEHSPAGFDQEAVGVHLVAGWNEILAKVGNTESSDWRFSARITTPGGEPVVLAADSAGHARPDAAKGNAPAVTDLTSEAKAGATNASGELLYAWVLSHKRNFNTGDHLDADTFMAALAALPTDNEARLDFVEHDSDLSRRYQNLEQMLAADPGDANNDPRALTDRGGIELDRNEYWPARADFAAAMGLNAAAATATVPAAAALVRQPRAALGLFEVFVGMGIRAEAMNWAEQMRQAGLTTAGIAAPVAAALRHLGADQQALAWYGLAHTSDAGDPNIALGLADAQRSAGDPEAALATVRGALALDGELPSLYEVEARSLAGLDRAAEAVADMQKAVELNPDNPDLHVDAGELQSQFGHTDQALHDWQAALALNPQDAALRDRLQAAQGGAATADASFEKPYTVDAAKTIAGYAQQATTALESGPVVVLADTTVVNIFPSGNNGRYVQQVFRVNNSSGADSLAVYSVTYDPATEDVHFLTARVTHPDGSTADAPEAGDQPVSESVGYETFYNVRNKFVQMPSMRPGDFVEIAYRVLPTTLESLYGDYFGDLTPFGTAAPTLLQQYVVITPANKNLYTKAIRFNGQAEEHEAGGQKIYQWTDRNLPAFVGEPEAPPAIEQTPYVAVSSFQTWDQFANWYSQLIRNTFVMDDEMVQTVQTLIAGKSTTEDKVDAIYRWVIQNTHYVALEFGIHGYRPYPVTQVFHRRFGDCKDKASLLIAMLHQAGVDAEFVLVRTRDLGVIDATIPSVADFDHAIAYVPALHRYLDGTAEFEGAAELPGGDQRAFVLRVPVVALDPTAKIAAMAPVVTPEQPPSANLSQRVLTGELDGSGNLHFRLTWELKGGRAPEFRQALELPDRRAGVLQAMLHDRLPGISVLRASAQNINDWDLPVLVLMEGTVPRFATVSGNTLLIPRQFLPTSWLPQMAALAQRRYDVLTDPPEEMDEEMDLTLPPGYQAALPPATKLDQPFATFQASATAKGQQVVLQTQLITTQSLIPPAEYAGFRDFWSNVDATLGRPISTQTAAGGTQ